VAPRITHSIVSDGYAPPSTSAFPLRNAFWPRPWDPIGPCVVAAVLPPSARTNPVGKRDAPLAAPGANAISCQACLVQVADRGAIPAVAPIGLGIVTSSHGGSIATTPPPTDRTERAADGTVTFVSGIVADAGRVAAMIIR
jgi:hypothetical protein